MVLIELMRTARIEKKLRYYVGKNADATDEEIWDLGDTPRNSHILIIGQVKKPSNQVVRGGLEPPTPGFSVQCSTN